MNENTNDSLIQANGIIKTYGKGESAFSALNDINFDIKRGDTVAIIGKSGSGKSTLMHILALLDKPDKGSLYIDSKNVSKMSAKELMKFRNKGFGFVFQQFFMNGRQTVLDNVMLPLIIAGIPRKERKHKAMLALQEVDLADKASNKAKDLSGGQKQRVVIARAIVNDPEIIFADEPTGNLDTKTGQQIENLLFALNKNKNITLIVVTHDQEFADKFNRQIKIQDGMLVD